jgi:hypothetical protein
LYTCFLLDSAVLQVFSHKLTIDNPEIGLSNNKTEETISFAIFALPC